jgi:hypothetical protein
VGCDGAGAVDGRRWEAKWEVVVEAAAVVQSSAVREVGAVAAQAVVEVGAVVGLMVVGQAVGHHHAEVVYGDVDPAW